MAISTFPHADLNSFRIFCLPNLIVPDAYATTRAALPVAGIVLLSTYGVCASGYPDLLAKINVTITRWWRLGNSSRQTRGD